MISDMKREIHAAARWATIHFDAIADAAVESIFAGLSVGELSPAGDPTDPEFPSRVAEIEGDFAREYTDSATPDDPVLTIRLATTGLGHAGDPAEVRIQPGKVEARRSDGAEWEAIFGG